MTEPSLNSGMMIIHSNKLEHLAEMVVYWQKQYPLAPLENDIVLVQSNGMGQWLKQMLASEHGLGIAASIHMQLPSLFAWQMYRTVLDVSIPKEQPLAKAPLTWRLHRLLPSLIGQAHFESLAHFLRDDSNGYQCFQLASQLADLFDQYQVYRSDWISHWAQGGNELLNLRGERLPIPPSQQWQPMLWRAILADVKGDERVASRASVHADFMQHSLTQRPCGMPRRVMLFGLSSLPKQLLEVMAKMSHVSQIILFVNNPCRHYWADIIEDKELFKTTRQRQRYKSSNHQTIDLEDMHLHAPPLLCAWGKQGRDYIRLLDEFDETHELINMQDVTVDIFDDYGDDRDKRSLLEHLQQSILDLEPIPVSPIVLKKVDDSLIFHLAHSPQREVEILHDQLLARFNLANERGQALYPRDVIVMVPDINQYAPHIRAVFGQFDTADNRFIPYSIADQQQRKYNPLIIALESLVHLPQSRFSVSEILTLLEVPALRARFAIDDVALPQLQQWIEESGIRWGLDAAQRRELLNMPSDSHVNTWQFGLRRLLLGYISGSGGAFNDIEPYDEIGGLEARWLGGLYVLLHQLETYRTLFLQPRCVSDWHDLLRDLLDDFFLAQDEKETKTLETLNAALNEWLNQCQQGDMMQDELSYQVVASAWLESIDQPALHQRFLSGCVNFCTLMPMRAIPFKLICLLGMNDGDYPRMEPIQSFDLMMQRGQYRPGDRVRRQDDQYLFLEAFLSARQAIYISWVARNICDNSYRPPSIMISQLRDVIEQTYYLDGECSLLDAMTVEHPLQPFSLTYLSLTRSKHLVTYAKEWFAPTEITSASEKNITRDNQVMLTIDSLARFLRYPVKTTCQKSLKVNFEQDIAISQDDEPFAFDALEQYLLSVELLTQCAKQEDLSLFFAQAEHQLARQGRLPHGRFAQYHYEKLVKPVQATWGNFQQLRHHLGLSEREAVSIQLETVLESGVSMVFSGHLSPLYAMPSGEMALCHLRIDKLLSAKKTIEKYHALLFAWATHLSACARYQPLISFVIASDSIIQLPPIQALEAHQHLMVLLNAYWQGMQTPLPLDCRSGFQWLLTGELDDARRSYEGDEYMKGEIDYDPYLQRFFADFDALNAQGQFDYWATTLYQPLLHVAAQWS